VHTELKNSFRQKNMFIAAEEHILVRADNFFNLGFNHKTLSPSQIAAVGARIRHAQTFNDAREDVIKFLKKQKQKLESKGGAKKRSWLIPARNDPEEKCLADTLIEWVTKEKYLQVSGSSIAIDRYAALCRFWSLVTGLYSYRKTMGADMRLAKEKFK